MRGKRVFIILLTLCLSIPLMSMVVSAAGSDSDPVVTASNVASTGKIKLDWEPVDGAAKYQVYRSTSANGKFTRLTSVTKSELVNFSIDAGDRYYYYVKALSSSGKVLGTSNTVNRTCDLPQPEITISNAASTGKITVSWKKIDGAVKYQVYRSTSKNGTYKLMGSSTTTKYTNSSAAAGKKYYYKVRAIASNTAANSAYSAPKSRVCDLARPVVTLSNVASTGKISITWEPIDGAVKYNVYRSTSKDGTYSRLGSPTDTKYVNTGVEVGKTYYYKVQAIASNEDANSAQSAAKSRTCDLPRPSITLSNVESSGKIAISWKAIDGAVKYQVYRSTSENGTYSLLSTTTKTKITNTSATGGKTYWYKVRAVASNTSANSAYSTVKSRACDLAKPTVKIANDAFTGRVQLTWEPVSNAVKYWVYRAASADGTYTCVKTVTDCSWTDPSGEMDKKYFYKVRAVSSNDSAHSALSAALSGTYTAPKELSVQGTLKDGKPRLNWNEISGAAQYDIYRSYTKEGTYKKIYSTESLAMTNTGAPWGMTLYYRINAVDANGKTLKESVNTVSLTTGLPETEVPAARYVWQPSATLYTLPDSNSDSLIIPYMTPVKLGLAATESSSGSWYRVFYEDELYYLWVTSETKKLTDQRSSFKYPTENEYQRQVVDLAYKIWSEWDTVYVHDQSNGVQNADGTYGFDCSGFASYVLNTVMQQYVPTYRLTKDVQDLRTTDSIYNAGYPGEYKVQNVELSELQPGDVIFFTQDSPYNHCGIYVGNNEFIHSSNYWENSVTLSPLRGSYAEQVAAIRRYLPNTVTSADTERTVTVNSCKLYSERSTESDILYTFKTDETVTVLFTNSNNWAYVRIADGTEGFMLTKNLAE